MMIPSSLVASLILSVNSISAHVGDQATYNGTVNFSGQTAPVTLSMKVTAQDASTGLYTVETTQTVAGQSQTMSEGRSADDIGDEATATQLVSNCAALGYVAETIAVAGQNLNTCKISQTQGTTNLTINIGAIPFMIAKYLSVDTANATTLDLTLNSFVRGQ